MVVSKWRIKLAANDEGWEIQEIAQQAKLSKTAVSYALNGTGRLDPATRARIIKIAEEAGYRPNPHARNLRRRKSGVLAVSVSLPTTMSEALPNMDYLMRIWQGAVATAHERGYMLLLAPFGTRPHMLSDVPMDGGMIIDPVFEDPVAAHLEANGVPVVTIGKVLGKSADKTWWVDSPHGELATEIFTHLRSRGSRRIGVILSTPKYGFSVAVRDAYLDWIASTQGEALLVEIEGPPTEAVGYGAAMRLLDLPEPPDAIYAVLDRLAVGALFAAEKRGIKVPDDLLLAAGSDGIITRTAPVPITALDLQPDRLGWAAVSMLLDRIEHNVPPRSIIIPGHIQMRTSTESSVRSASRFGPKAARRRQDPSN